jgi:hypothetical protein
MTITESHRDHCGVPTTPPVSKWGLLAGAGAFFACMLACSLPLIAAGGLTAGFGAFLRGDEGVALLVLAAIAAVAGAGFWLRGRRAHSTGGGCSCGNSCGC